jgi:hypothetical protein
LALPVPKPPELDWDQSPSGPDIVAPTATDVEKIAPSAKARSITPITKAATRPCLKPSSSPCL